MKTLPLKIDVIHQDGVQSLHLVAALQALTDLYQRPCPGLPQRFISLRSLPSIWWISFSCLLTKGREMCVKTEALTLDEHGAALLCVRPNSRVAGNIFHISELHFLLG